MLSSVHDPGERELRGQRVARGIRIDIARGALGSSATAGRTYLAAHRGDLNVHPEVGGTGTIIRHGRRRWFLPR